MSLTQHIYIAFDASKQLDLIYTDLAKVFDWVGGAILFDKLSSLYVPSNIIFTLKSYISQRKNFVNYEGYSSHPYIATSTVPQGSVFCTVLFTIYINDVNTLDVEKLSFVDDLKIFSVMTSESDVDNFQRNLDIFL